ncbi:FAD-binding oxidoreductase [Desulfomonile tiedjei]|uniref:FAD/FMN-dependent dehydrogenase n=1 Tax=Desulfomonile tiedjei (strain ATCC 49306 / DSM 6799 / DCB-1) TaxID=706587 RepID=I4CEU9_DESTA|nr:FAD-binding oxidoreductase [Desulfomonile tiedjei]AFM28090.1 FAD/FMN-dependent dehydrogenase [Desulfomonile tiedjei DSM 6799]
MKTDFVKRLIEICGSEHVLRSPEAIELYSRCTIPWSRTCGAVALPDNVDQVSRIVQLCNEYGTPVWTFSRGHNWGYGTVLALQQGALILILRRMNRIHEVNEELCYAVVEPGVSQGQLNGYLKSKGFNLWIDCTDSSPDGSLIGNALDKGVGYTPYGDHFGNLCGMEVVLANGQVVTTGGVSKQCPTRHIYQWGVGPCIDGLFAQSSLGIVTKAGLWLMPKPEAFEMFVIGISDPKPLAPVIDAQRKLALRGIISHCHGFNAFLALARSIGYPSHLLDGKQLLDKEVIEQLAAEQGLPPWTFVGGIYGTSRQVRTNKREIAKYLSRLGHLVFIGELSQKSLNRIVEGVRRPGFHGAFYRGLKSFLHLFVDRISTKTIESLLALYPILRGEPNEDILAAAYFKNKERQPKENLDPARDACGLIFFAPILPAIGNEIQVFLQNIERICSSNHFETAVLLIQSNPRTFIVLVPLFFDRTNAEEAERCQRTYDQLCEFLKIHHYQQYRCTTPQMDNILQDNPSYQDFMKKIKLAIDPNHIIAAGRYGV